MESSNQVYEIFTSIAIQLPSLLTIMGGIVLAILRWKRHPGVSSTIAVGLGLMLLHLLFFTVVYAVLPTLMAGAEVTTLQTVYTLVSVAYNFTLAIFTTILLVAIFMRRHELPEDPLYEQVAQARAA